MIYYASESGFLIFVATLPTMIESSFDAYLSLFVLLVLRVSKMKLSLGVKLIRPKDWNAIECL
jgi:hypothetical protein